MPKIINMIKTVQYFGMTILMIIIGCIPIIAQKENKDSYLVNAKSCFDKGEYQKARSYIIKYATNDGDRQIATEFSTKCKSCEDYISKANAAYINGDYGTAEQYYIRLKELNPKHPGIREAIDKCEKRISGAKDVAGTVESSSKQSAKPASARKNYLKSFSNIFKDYSYINSGKNEFTAWNVGIGYPWNIVTGFEYRGGGVIGYGLYGDIGIDFTRITYEEYSGHYVWKGGTDTELIKDSRAFDHILKKDFRWAGGLKLYPYKGFFIDFGYGTIASTSARVEKKVIGTPYAFADDHKEEIFEQISVGHGWLFHVGCISVSNLSHGGGGFFSVSGGFAYDVVNEETVPSINIKFGYAW